MAENTLTSNLNDILTNFPKIEFSRIHELRDLDNSHSLLYQLLEIFKNESHRQISAMRLFNAQGDFLNLSKAAHKYRSTAFNIGALRVGELSKKIEILCSSNEANQKELDVLLQVLENEYQSIVPLLKDIEN